MQDSAEEPRLGASWGGAGVLPSTPTKERVFAGGSRPWQGRDALNSRSCTERAGLEVPIP